MDFFRASRRFNVQSSASANPFWTSSRLSAASTSNLPLLQIPFGLLPCFPLLQRPICHSFSLLLDFLLPSRRFNVQSAASANPFWTSSCLPAASTSNPPLFLTPSANPFWTSSCLPAASTHAFVVYEYFINYYLTLISEYFIFLL